MVPVACEPFPIIRDFVDIRGSRRRGPARFTDEELIAKWANLMYRVLLVRKTTLLIRLCGRRSAMR